MTQESPVQPERPPDDRYRRRHEKNEKDEEKRNEKDEKNRGEKWEEKWRRDPINAGSWALIFIWAGLCVLAEVTKFGSDNFSWWSTWGVILAGAGAIFILGALIRLLMPEHRRSIIGNLIIGCILLGIGLRETTDWNWGVLGAFILIAIGIIIIFGGVFRRRK